jgi:hypothetical protein
MTGEGDQADGAGRASLVAMRRSTLQVVWTVVLLDASFWLSYSLTTSATFAESVGF